MLSIPRIPEADCDVVAYLIHRDAWYLQVVETPALSGSHFLDILEPNIGDVIRNEISGAPKVDSNSFLNLEFRPLDPPRSRSPKSTEFLSFMDGLH
eukprot:2321643-Amphidinium_carterae.1